MCWLAIGFLIIIFIFLLGRSYKDALYPIDIGQVLLEGWVTDKQYKESAYGDYWQVTLKKVRIARQEWKAEKETAVNTENVWSGKETVVYKEGDLRSKETAVYKEEGLNGKGIAVKIETLEGKYLCRISATGNEELRIGQKVFLKGTYESFEAPTNPGQFNTGKYYCSLGILGQFKKCTIIKQGSSFSLIRENLWRLRQQIYRFLMAELGEENGALISAMLLGEKSGLEEEQKSLYQRNGISHILAISGLHLSLLGMGVFRFLKAILANHRKASVIAIIIMLFYCVFTGSSISTIRATIMFALSLFAGVLGRSYDSLSALGLAAILQLFINPYVLNNSGFLLSFLAVIGVTFLAPRLQELMGAKHKLSKSLCISMSASITTLPVLLTNYGTYPWYSVFLNLLILPPMSVLLFLAVLLLFLLMPPGSVWLWQALGSRVGVAAALVEIQNVLAASSLILGIKRIVVWGINLILKYFEICCEIFEKITDKERYIGAPNVLQIVVYATLVLVALSKIVKYSELVRKMILLSALGILTVNFNVGGEVTMLDVGQGDSVVIRNNNGHVYISDCGSSSVNKVGKYRLLPFLRYKGYGKIQGIFISHLDEDHMNGIMELLEIAPQEKVKIKYLFLPESVLEAKEDWETLNNLLDLAKKNETEVVYLAQGEKIQDGKMSFYCLYPEGIEDFKEKYIGITGSIESIDENLLTVEKSSSAGNSSPAGKSSPAKKFEKSVRKTTDNRNNQSLVLFMQYEEFEMMLTGDVELQGEEGILSYIDRMSPYEFKQIQDGRKINQDIVKQNEDGRKINLDVLKVAHHGSSGSSCEEFLEKVNPKLSLISCGKNNSYGHPHEETLERLDEVGSKVMSTVESGAITIKIGRKKIKVYEFK